MDLKRVRRQPQPNKSFLKINPVLELPECFFDNEEIHEQTRAAAANHMKELGRRATMISSNNDFELQPVRQKNMPEDTKDVGTPGSSRVLLVETESETRNINQCTENSKRPRNSNVVNSASKPLNKT